MAGRFDALEQTWRSLESVLTDLPEDAWSLPTGCPGWSVKDNVSHIAGLEHNILGEPDPDHQLAEHLPHVRDDNGRHMELAVDFRRSWTPEEVLADFREVTRRRLGVLRADDTPPDAEVKGPFAGTLSYSALMGIRVFDCYAHEQDVRRATGYIGNLSGPAADIARRRVVRGWTQVLGNLPLLEGVHVVLDLDATQHELTEPEGATSQLRLGMDLLTAVPLACGRADASPEAVEVNGDRDVWESTIPYLGFTP